MPCHLADVEMPFGGFQKEVNEIQQSSGPDLSIYVVARSFTIKLAYAVRSISVAIPAAGKRFEICLPLQV